MGDAIPLQNPLVLEFPSEMSRIFLTLMLLSVVLLGAAFVLGLQIADPRVADPQVQTRVNQHFLTSLAALVCACLLHAMVLTYFMGTGRWIEETSQAYGLADRWLSANRDLKYRTIPAMAVCILLLVVTGALGGAADPASPVGFQGAFGITAATIHLLIALLTLGVNLLVYLHEYRALRYNGRLVDEVLQEVRRMRQERGLPV